MKIDFAVANNFGLLGSKIWAKICERTAFHGRITYVIRFFFKHSTIDLNDTCYPHVSYPFWSDIFSVSFTLFVSVAKSHKVRNCWCCTFSFLKNGWPFHATTSSYELLICLSFSIIHNIFFSSFIPVQRAHYSHHRLNLSLESIFFCTILFICLCCLIFGISFAACFEQLYACNYNILWVVCTFHRGHCLVHVWHIQLHPI